MKSQLDRYQGQQRGWGPWRQRWLSICSAHRVYEVGCNRCATGFYASELGRHLERWSSQHFYGLWHWWVNRPNSPQRRRLEEIFPKLKG